MAEEATVAELNQGKSNSPAEKTAHLFDSLWHLYGQADEVHCTRQR